MCVCVHGETYEVCVSSVCKTDEYDRLVLRNEIYFLEEATARIINVYFNPLADPHEIEIHFDETPGKTLIINCLGMVTGNNEGFSISGFVMNKLTEYGAMDAVTQTIMDTVSPVINAYLHIDYDNLIEAKESINELTNNESNDDSNIEEL